MFNKTTDFLYTFLPAPRAKNQPDTRLFLFSKCAIPFCGQGMLKNDRVKKKEPPYVAVINRLDQPVEGLVLFAKTKEAAASKCCRLLLRAFSEQYIIQAGIQDFK